VLNLVDEPIEELFDVLEGEYVPVGPNFTEGFIVTFSDERLPVRLGHVRIQFYEEVVPLWLLKRSLESWIDLGKYF
jgi:hypothetical protein